MCRMRLADMAVRGTANVWFFACVTLLLRIFLAGTNMATLAAILDPMTQMKDDISRIKVMMESVGEQLERFNSLYLSKLETRLLNGATSLAHIDSNVKNLQERAHVWDTFQLHVSAWNEQIKSLDKKLAILSRGAEKWDLLDEKVGSLLPLEYKLEKIKERIEESDAKITDIQRKVTATATSPALLPSGETPLFSEFTSRGVLSAIKEIELKINKLLEKSPAAPPAAGGGTNGGEDCSVQKQILDVVNDMAGKVDFILDKMVVKRHTKQMEAIDTSDEGLYDDDDEQNGDLPPAEKAFAKLWKKMLLPVRRANKRFENLDKVLGQLEKLGNSSANKERSVLNDIQTNLTTLLQCCRNGHDERNNFVKTLEDSIKDLKNQFKDRCITEELLNQRIQRIHSEILESFRESVSFQIGSGFDRIKETCSSSSTTKIGSRKRNSSGETGKERLADEESTKVGFRDPSVRDPVEEDRNKEVDETKKILRGCEDLRMTGETESQVYSLSTGKELNEGGRDYYTRFCDMTTDGGGWTVIQRRGNYGGNRQNFSLSWRDYKLGFGDLNREFWFGNYYIHRLTNENDVVLRVELWDFEDNFVYAEYESFRVDSEEDLFRLWVEGYSGNATDSLGSHNGYAFSTYDRDNDEAPPCCPCAPAYGGGWWFYSCFEANLNGDYFENPTENDYFRGIIWELWKGDYSLKRAEMKIRPKHFTPPPQPPETTPTALDPALSEDIPEDP